MQQPFERHPSRNGHRRGVEAIRSIVFASVDSADTTEDDQGTVILNESQIKG